MKIPDYIEKIGPTNFILLFLFPVLCNYEFVDGRFDVGDYGVALLYVLFLNDIYTDKLGNAFRAKIKKISSKKFIIPSYSKYRTIDLSHIPLLTRRTHQGWFVYKSKEKTIKTIMNIIFTFLILGPLFIDGSKIDTFERRSFFKFGIMLWSCIFLTMSFYDWKIKRELSKKIFVNIGLVILIGTVVLL